MYVYDRRSLFSNVSLCSTLLPTCDSKLANLKIRSTLMRRINCDNEKGAGNSKHALRV